MRNAGGEAKIDKLGLLLCLVKKDVLQLDVSVGYIPLMTIVDGLHNLSPEELRFELRHLPIRLHLQIPMQAATVDKLHDQKDLLVRLKGFVELGNVLMIELLHDFHFSLDALSSVGLHQLDLLVDLDGDLLIQHFVETKADNSVSSLAKTLTDEIVVEVLD